MTNRPSYYGPVMSALGLITAGDAPPPHDVTFSHANVHPGELLRCAERWGTEIVIMERIVHTTLELSSFELNGVRVTYQVITEMSRCTETMIANFRRHNDVLTAPLDTDDDGDFIPAGLNNTTEN